MHVVSHDGTMGVVNMKAEGTQQGTCDGATFESQAAPPFGLFRVVLGQQYHRGERPGLWALGFGIRLQSEAG